MTKFSALIAAAVLLALAGESQAQLFPLLGRRASTGCSGSNATYGTQQAGCSGSQATYGQKAGCSGGQATYSVRTGCGGSQASYGQRYALVPVRVSLAPVAASAPVAAPAVPVSPPVAAPPVKEKASKTHAVPVAPAAVAAPAAPCPQQAPPATIGYALLPVADGPSYARPPHAAVERVKAFLTRHPIRTAIHRILFGL